MNCERIYLLLQTRGVEALCAIPVLGGNNTLVAVHVASRRDQYAGTQLISPDALRPECVQDLPPRVPATLGMRTPSDGLVAGCSGP